MFVGSNSFDIIQLNNNRNLEIPQYEREDSIIISDLTLRPSLISDTILLKTQYEEKEEEEEGEKEENNQSITFHNFRLLKLIGKGSFGKVFLVSTKTHNNEYYALKALKKQKIIESNDVQSTKLERDIANLGYVNRFITKLYCAFQDNEYVYFLMEFLNGGDLMFHIESANKFSETRTRFYAAQILCGLEFLHSENIVYRDLKLDNILLDSKGHCKISDFGMCRVLMNGELAATFCGTPDYIAPEILQGYMYDYAVDYWSYGILIYEMLTGRTPFNGKDEEDLFNSIKHQEIVYPSSNEISFNAENILRALLEREPRKRLGSVKTSPHGCIRQHVFFNTIDWFKLEMGCIEPPFKPNLVSF